MYRIRTSDGQDVFYQGDPEYTAYDTECYTAKGDAGYLKFTIPNTNPMYGKLITRKTVLEFLIDSYSLGFYEVREISHSANFEEDVYAVGELAWLFDSVQPQAEFHDIAPRAFLSTLIGVHNQQCPEHQFQVGKVDVVDTNDSLYRYTNRETTLECIRDKLVERLGGQIKLRRTSGGIRYIDYLTDDTYGTETTQRIYFGENLLEYSDTLTVADICSSVIPLGYRLENDSTNSKLGNLDQRLTIESVNGGKDWVSDSKLVQRFGNIRTTRIWDEVTVPQNLLNKARQWLSSEQFESMHLTVRAIDLSMTSSGYEKLVTGDTVNVVAEPYGLDRKFPITARTYHPDKPDDDTFEIGDTVKASYIKSQNSENKKMVKEATENRRIQAQWLTDAIDNVTAMMRGDRGGYKFSEYDDEGRWLADYYLDSMDKDKAKVVHKVNLNGDAYSTNGINGPYEAAILANGTILGKFIEAHSIRAEQISQEYTSAWEDADKRTLNTARSEFRASDSQITSRVTQVETDTRRIKTDLAAEIKVRSDQISQTVKRGQINSSIAQTAETIYIKSNKFGWQSTNSSLTTDGKLTAKNANFTNCSLSGTLVTASNERKVTMSDGKLIFEYKGPLSDWKWKKTGQIYANMEWSVAKYGAKVEVVEFEAGTAKMHLRKENARIESDSVSLSARSRSYIIIGSKNDIDIKASRINLLGSVYVNGRRI